MCGRASLTLQEKELQEAFGADFYEEDVVKYNPQYNIAPTHFLPILQASESKTFRMAHWGYWRKWKDFKTGKTTKRLNFNARGETVHELKTFAPSFREGRRCIFVFDGFYEWMQTKETGKVPFRIGLKSREPFAIAGIWEEFEHELGNVAAATLITTEPNEMMRLVHNKPGKERMPAILTQAEWEQWLDPAVEPNEARSLIQTYPADDMYCHPVTNDLNKEYKNEDKFIQPVHYDMAEHEFLEKASDAIGFELAS
jgi:putative SOS response-associated peptidase YedK